MLQTVQSWFDDLRGFLAWAPDDIVGIIVLAIAGVIALSIHSTVVRLVRYLLGSRHPYARSFLTRTNNLTRVALFVLALFAALPAAGFRFDVTWLIARVLFAATILLVGWAAIIATDLAADIYLMRFRLDVADNLTARKHVTQVRVLRRAVNVVLVVVTIGAALMTSESVRQFGLSLFASAGVAGLIAGLAARPVLSNLFAGLQLAIAQPIRIGDAVIVENESGTIEEITSTYVVVRIWDLRRLIVPLSYFIERPFQNWTREDTKLIGIVLLHVDYAAPVARIREKAFEIVRASPCWDGDVLSLQVTDTTERTMELRILASARDGGDTFQLRCEIREKLIEFLQQESPEALPRDRQELLAADERLESARKAVSP